MNLFRKKMNLSYVNHTATVMITQITFSRSRSRSATAVLPSKLLHLLMSDKIHSPAVYNKHVQPVV